MEPRETERERLFHDAFAFEGGLRYVEENRNLPTMLSLIRRFMIIPEIKNILYTTDLSENSRHAFSYAVSLAERYGAKVTIFHVVEGITSTIRMLLSAYLEESELERIQKGNEEAVLEIMRNRLKQFCDETPVSCPQSEMLVRSGNAVDEILSQARKGGFDLMVMGSHGHGFFEDTMMGSTAQRVLRRSKIPVLVVRLPKEAAG